MSICTSVSILLSMLSIIAFFINDTATSEIYTLSLHDALPIYLALLDDPELRGRGRAASAARAVPRDHPPRVARPRPLQDRKSTRLNSSHSSISYAVFCLKKKTVSILLSMPSIIAISMADHAR